MDKEKIKTLLLKKYKKKFKPEILKTNIDGIVDEFIENRKFIKENNLKVKDLPTREDVNSWFEDELPIETIKKYLDNDDKIARIELYEIYHKDKIAKEVFKNLYDYKYDPQKDLDKHIQLLIKYMKLSEHMDNKDNRDKILSRIANIAFLGTIRFYHMERLPYLTKSQIDKIIERFFRVLDIIYNIENGKYKDKILKGEIYIFKTLDDEILLEYDEGE